MVEREIPPGQSRRKHGLDTGLQSAHEGWPAWPRLRPAKAIIHLAMTANRLTFGWLRHSEETFLISLLNVLVALGISSSKGILTSFST